MTQRADARRAAIGPTILAAAVSIVAVIAAVVLIFFVVLWGARTGQTWIMALGILIPITVTLAAAALLAAHFAHLRLARAAAARRAIEEELQAILKSDVS